MYLFPALCLLLSRLQWSQKGMEMNQNKRFITGNNKTSFSHIIRCRLSSIQMPNEDTKEPWRCMRHMWEGSCCQSYLTTAGHQRLLQQTLSKTSSSSVWPSRPQRKTRWPRVFLEEQICVPFHGLLANPYLLCSASSAEMGLKQI